MSVDQILADKEMLNYAIGSSKVLYGDNCAACHGAGGAPAEGAGYPNLTDDDWLYGGTVDEIQMSIAKGRQGLMPAHEKLLKPEEVDQLVKFVIDSSNGVKMKLVMLCSRQKVVSHAMVLMLKALKKWDRLT